jgi:hypothetical protein
MPTPVTVRLFAVLIVPSTIALASVTWIAFAPLLLRSRAGEVVRRVVSVIGLAPAPIKVVPAT